MVASASPGWLQTAFDVLTGLFDRVGLWKNFRNNVGMVCQPCQAVRFREDEAYKGVTRRGNGNGSNFRSARSTYRGGHWLFIAKSRTVW